MKTPFTCHILIPEDLRANPLFQIPEGIKQELTCEYYQTVSPKMMDCGHAIQLVVLNEEAFTHAWWTGGVCIGLRPIHTPPIGVPNLGTSSLS